MTLRKTAAKPGGDLLQGTLDMLVLQALRIAPAHGYTIARVLEQRSDAFLKVEQGSIYPALIRLEQQGWIRTQWAQSETNRRVKFYSLTAAGTRQLRVEVANWERATALVARFLEAKP